MLIPRVMNGLEKSITFSLSEVMVKPATARSAFCKEKEEKGRAAMKNCVLAIVDTQLVWRQNRRMERGKAYCLGCAQHKRIKESNKHTKRREEECDLDAK